MKVHIHEAGDPMVGIIAFEFEMDIPIDAEPSELEGDERERIRDVVLRFYRELVDESWPTGVRFDDECSDCMTAHEPGDRCPALDGVFE